MSRLRARLQGRKARKQRRISAKRFDDPQEAALIRWIEAFGVLRFPPTPRMIEASANAMLQRKAEGPGNPSSLSVRCGFMTSCVAYLMAFIG
jgi:hypothetical protein